MTEPATPSPSDGPSTDGPSTGGTSTGGSDAYDARTGSGDPETDPAAVGERSFQEPDGDGGAVPDEPAT